VSPMRSIKTPAAILLSLALACAGLAGHAAEPEQQEAAAPAGAGAAAEPGEPAAAADADVTKSPGRAQRRNVGSGVDQRVRLLTAELKLDAKQQAKVRTVLVSQREQVAKVWSDPSLPSAIRVKATQSIGDRTADQIRMLLSAEQRKLYIQPRSEKLANNGERPDVEKWMSGSKAK
jgi:hypothetical protein